MEKEKASKRTREERSEHKDRDRDRDRELKHRSRDGEGKRSSKDDKARDAERQHSRHYHRSSRDSYRERSYEPREHKSRRERSSEGREGSYERELKQSYELRGEREGSRDEESYKRYGDKDKTKLREVKREHSNEEYEDEREKSQGRPSDSVISSKRKERSRSEDRLGGSEKRTRVSEDVKLRMRTDVKEEESGGERQENKERKYEDGVYDDDEILNGRGKKRERRRFGDRAREDDDGAIVEKQLWGAIRVKVKEEVVDKKIDETGTANGSGLLGNDPSVGSLIMAKRSVSELLPPSHPLPIKVSSISTTNENKGVSMNRFHEVPGKSSTDGASSTAGKSGNLSLDALAKAKKALQMQKELSEKLKKIPMLSKTAVSNSEGSSILGLKEAPKSQAAKDGSLGFTPLASATLPAATATATHENTTGNVSASAGVAFMPGYEAVKRAQELAARMGFRQDPLFAPLINLFPGQMTTEVAVPQKPSKAPVLRLDALGREIDEHGNVVNITKPSNLSTLKVNINKLKKDAFRVLKPELDVDPESNPHFDAGMGINKTKLLRPKRMSFQFVEEGKWTKEAETLKLRSQFGEAQAKERKEKQAQLAKAKAAPDINPNLIEVSERVILREKPKDPIPDIEWWDVPLLHHGTYDDVSDAILIEEKIKKDKITIYVEHPRPIEPPAESAPPPPQPLKLTKKEQKKLRTQRRLAREKEKQEMIRQGLIEPPKAKVKMSNLMKVLGSEATQDPTKLEKEIRTAAAEREQAHIDRNIARKLTPAERREKKERKLFEESNSGGTYVAVYKVNDLSHPQARFKVDVNARENRLAGCAVISDGMSVVVVEGGSKSIKRYSKVMLRRINWATAVKDEDEAEDENDEKPLNKCVLVWQGSVAKPAFHRFSIQEFVTEAAARKFFADAGVGHYWDLAVNFTDDQI